VFGSWAAWLLAKSKRARFVYGIFDMHPESAANAGLIKRGVAYRILQAADTILCRLADAIVTLGEGLRAEIVARGIRPEKVAIVPFWLDGRRIQPGPRDNPWRRDQGIGPETFVALYAGTIGHVSGAQVLIDTASLLAERKDILILCVGGGPVRGRLVADAARARLQNIRFVPFQPAAVLDRVQASADVGLVTLLPEAGKSSLPSKILGYLAAGRPVIASVAAESDTAELIRVAGCGRVAKCMDPAELADAIVTLADSASACEEYGRCGRAYFERVFDRPVCVGAYERILMNGSVKGEICL
jgi:colanic acid biosynthesis glycosyl transferase WcaI